MGNYLIKGAQVVNEGKTFFADVLVRNDRIEKIASSIGSPTSGFTEINAEGQHLLPGVIDDQVHFREPGLTHKGEIFTESRAAVAGGLTSFMEMPNTNPQTITQERLEEKYRIGAARSAANYSFYMGATNDNLEEVLKTRKDNVCGVKVFMGSSTGNMLVDNEHTLSTLFSECDHLIAIHSESESVIKSNLERIKEQYGNDIPMSAHPLIRDEEACYQSTQKAVALARKHDTRLHILHISTAEELDFFSNHIPLKDKKITSEVCVHHLWFAADDYSSLGGQIKCNPAIKAPHHRSALWQALLDDRLDIIATDHAPHTREEKGGDYLHCPSGLPLVQHSLLMMLEAHKQGKITLEKLVQKMSHAPAQCFRISDRGYIREGAKADLVLVDLDAKTTVDRSNILYKSGWSPLEGYTFSARIVSTFINGNLVFDKGKVIDGIRGERLLFA
ncbi:MAG: dihydroorotase [Bacteroidota bacterium]|nr:dihydroorotase [Bacteroidota bacterium]